MFKNVEIGREQEIAIYFFPFYIFPLFLYFWLFRPHLECMDGWVILSSLPSTTFTRSWFSCTFHLTPHLPVHRVSPPASAMGLATRCPNQGRRHCWVWSQLRGPRGRPFPAAFLLASSCEPSCLFRGKIYRWNDKEQIEMDFHRAVRACNFSVLTTLISMLKTGFAAVPLVSQNIWALLIQLLLQSSQHAKYVF